jgi:hypothetical protein
MVSSIAIALMMIYSRILYFVINIVSNKFDLSLSSPQALTTDWKEKPLDAEVDLWDEGRMECLSHLTQWDELEAIATQGLGGDNPSLEAAWEDAFYMVGI